MVRNGWVSPFCFQTVYPFAGLWKPCFYLVRFPYSSSGWRMQPGCKDSRKMWCSCSWSMVKMVGKMCFAWLKCFQHTVIVWIYQCVYEVTEAWFCENIGPLKQDDVFFGRTWSPGSLNSKGFANRRSPAPKRMWICWLNRCKFHLFLTQTMTQLLNDRWKKSGSSKNDWFSMIQFTLNLFPFYIGFHMEKVVCRISYINWHVFLPEICWIVWSFETSGTLPLLSCAAVWSIRSSFYSHHQLFMVRTLKKDKDRVAGYTNYTRNGELTLLWLENPQTEWLEG